MQQRVHAIERYAAVRLTARPRAAVWRAFAVIALLGTGGCVSEVAGSLDQSYAPAEIASLSTNDTPSVIGAMADPTMSPPATPEQSGVQIAGASHGDFAAPEDIPAVDVVPEPAPRDGAGNPRLKQGIVLAFGESDSGEAVAMPAEQANVADLASEPVKERMRVEDAPANGGETAKPKSLFEALFQHWQHRQPANGATVRTASLGTPNSLATTDPGQVPTPGPNAVLPGVGDKSSLFEVDGEAHDDDEGDQVELASVGGFARMSPNGLRLQTERVQAECLNPGLITILKTAERHFGRPVIVTSGYRSPKDNRRAGGARKSLHMQCAAADIQIDGVSKWDLAAYLRTVPGRGGVGTYCRTRSVHIDIGDERSWHYPCRRTSKRKS